MTKKEASNRQMLKCPIIGIFTIDHLHAQILVQYLNTIKKSIKQVLFIRSIFRKDQ